MASYGNKKGSGGFIGFVLLLLGAAGIIGAVVAGSIFNLSIIAQIVIGVFGLLVFLFGGIITIVSNLYVRASSDRSFVRTGAGGGKAVIDGGALVISVVHETVPVSHKTMKIEVTRSGSDALITGDNLRADITSEFYIYVPKDENNVLMAASSMGEQGVNEDSVKKLMTEKLVDALRAVAGKKTLMELHGDRQGFAESVNEIVAKALEPNGLALESVTVSQLDQTPTRDINPDDNVFDAQGARAIAQIVAVQRVERNQLMRDAELKVKDQDVKTRKAVLARELEQEQAEAQTRREKAEAIATADAEAAKKEAEEKAKSQTADVARQEAVDVAEVKRKQAVDVANEAAARAKREAEIDRERAVEIADRESKIAIEEREKARAQAETERLEAEAEAEEARQKVLTVTTTETANRDKAKALIDEAADAEKEALRDRTKADVAAYQVKTKAEAEREAAEARATAVRTEADAAKDAAVAKAEGERAAALIPVEVDREKVAVEKERVAVRREELQNESEFSEIAAELQVRLATISAGKEVDIARATAMGDALGKAEMQFWGDPTTFEAMSNSFLGGQQWSMGLEGVLKGTPDEIKGFAGSLAGVAAGMVKKFTGTEATPEEALALVKSFFAGKTPEDIAELLKAAQSSEETDD